MTFCDAHCHLANLSQIMPLPPLLAEAFESGIGLYLSSALSRRELDFYAELNHPDILYSAGIHPNFPACDLEMSDIHHLASEKKIWAIGEIGLDRGNPDSATMESLFLQQLALAQAQQLPVVLHIVGHQQRAYEILRGFPLRYLIHGYAGSTEAFRLFLKLDAYFTISERLLKKDKALLLSEMLESKRYLFETDITRYYLKPGEKNPLLRLIDLAETVSHRYGTDISELKAIQYDNYLLLRGIK